MKDNFSAQSNLYAKFRPTYPVELYSFLFSHVDNFDLAWDCATGNGQVAIELSKKFKTVFATDISGQQLSNASTADNIIYKKEAAEKTTLDNNSADLITVAQAIHWFDFEKFYSEVNRVIKKGGLFAAISYGLCKFNDETDRVLKYFYEEITGKYWDPERRYIDEEYKTIPFPFKDITTPKLKITAQWNFDQFIGFLSTWSAVQHYQNENKTNPIDLVHDEFASTWREGEIKEVNFPVILRAAIIK